MLTISMVWSQVEDDPELYKRDNYNFTGYLDKETNLFFEYPINDTKLTVYKLGYGKVVAQIDIQPIYSDQLFKMICKEYLSKEFNK